MGRRFPSSREVGGNTDYDTILCGAFDDGRVYRYRSRSEEHRMHYVCVCVCACSLGGSLQRVLKDKGEFASQTGVADGFL